MAISSPTEQSTRDVAERWFTALAGGDMQTALTCLADDVEWINYRVIPGYNDVMPWIGTRRGPAAVLASFQRFISVCEPQDERLIKLAVDGVEAAGVVAEQGIVRATGLPYAIEFIQWLTIRDGKIVRWKSYTDPSAIEKAILGDSEPSLPEADLRTGRTYQHIPAWLDAMKRGDGTAVMAGLADDVEFVTPEEQDDLVIPYVGRKVGKAEVAAAFGQRAEIVETVSAELADVSAQGDQAWAFVTTRERHLPTGHEFTIEAAHQFQLDDEGHIRRWRAFFDPNPEVDVLRAALDAANPQQAPTV
jgi:ketosteroid isomerase-like protein